MKSSQELTFKHLSSEEGQLCTVDVNTLRPMPVEYETYEWKPITDAQKEQHCYLLDDINVLLIPTPKTIAEEEEMVNRFLDGVRKLFTPENNWTCLAMLDTTMDYCAQCNSCSQACHLYEMSGEHEMYRPNFRSEIFRRIYKQYVKKEPFAKWRYGDMDLNWKTVARLAEMAYRCNLCRRCAQVCPIGVDNGLIARELRKLFSQEFGWSPRELHEKGTQLQLQVGSSTGMNSEVVKETVEFIDEDYVESTGYTFTTPWDVPNADILLIHNAGEMLAWPDNIAAFSLIFEAAGLSWTLSSEIAGYDSVNYGVFYDDVQAARVAIKHAQAAKKLGVKKIVIGECGHAHKALTVIADRILPKDLNIPRESCFPLLRDIVLGGRLKLDPSRNNFPVTLHDPCNLVRLMGVVKPQRDVLHAIAPMFREMTPHGVENYCCGGGSGFAIMTRNNINEWRMNITGRKKMEQIANAFGDCLDPSIKKYVCAPCSNCKGQIRELLQENNLLEKNGMQYGGLVELIVNAMTEVEPGFIKWEEE